MEKEEERPSYEDENLTESEKEAGHTRLPMPEQEGDGTGGKQGDPMSPIKPDRPDEFGDGDRRS